MDAMRLAQLDTALQSLALSAGAYTGKAYRILSPLYGNKVDAFSGDGSLRASGRFHARGAFRIVYTGCTLQQAEWEYKYTSRNSGISREDNLPITTLSADVSFSKVLDLTDGRVRRRLKVTKKDLSQNTWSASSGETLTQAIGRLAHQHGFEAILAPSSGPGANINILPQNFLAGSSVQIVNEDRLPPPPAPPLTKSGTLPGSATKPKKRARRLKTP